MEVCHVACGYKEDSYNLKTDSRLHVKESMCIITLTASGMNVGKKKRIYWLNHTPCSWYERVNHELTNQNITFALFLWHDATRNLMGNTHRRLCILWMWFIAEKKWSQKWKGYLKMECIKVEHLNFGDWVVGIQKMELLLTKIYIFHLYPQ